MSIHAFVKQYSFKTITVVRKAYRIENPFSHTMDVVERLTPETDLQTTLENITMPIAVAVIFNFFLLILNLIDGDDDIYVDLASSFSFTLMAILLALWIGVAAVNAGGNIGDALVGSAIVGLVYGLLTALFQELFWDATDELRGYDKDFFLYIFVWTLLFVLVAIIGAGLAEDLFGEGDAKPAKSAPAKKAPAKKAPAKKKTTKKATTTDD